MVSCVLCGVSCAVVLWCAVVDLAMPGNAAFYGSWRFYPVACPAVPIWCLFLVGCIFVSIRQLVEYSLPDKELPEMVITREKEQEHKHLRYKEVPALALEPEQVFMSNGSALRVVGQVNRFVDEKNIIVWLCLFVENTSNEARSLFTTLATSAVLLDTYATCKEC